MLLLLLLTPSARHLTASTPSSFSGRGCTLSTASLFFSKTLNHLRHLAHAKWSYAKYCDDDWSCCLSGVTQWARVEISRWLKALVLLRTRLCEWVPDFLSYSTVLENTAAQWHPSTWLPPQTYNQQPVELEPKDTDSAPNEGTYTSQRVTVREQQEQDWPTEGDKPRVIPMQAVPSSARYYPMNIAGRVRSYSRHYQQPPEQKLMSQGPPWGPNQEQEKTRLETSYNI